MVVGFWVGLRGVQSSDIDAVAEGSEFEAQAASPREESFHLYEAFHGTGQDI